MNFDLLHTCNQKSVCTKTPQVAQALASYSANKGILRGFVRHSSSTPPEYPIRRLRGRLPKLSCVSDFRKNYPAMKKKYLVAYNAGGKYVTPSYAREIYSISTGLENKFLLRVNHPYLPSKDKRSTPND